MGAEAQSQRSAANSFSRRPMRLSHGWLQHTRALTPVQPGLAKTLQEDDIHVYYIIYIYIYRIPAKKLVCGVC